MNKMRFDVACVKACLVENGVVYTVRSYRLEGVCKVNVEGVGECLRTFLGEVKYRNALVEHVELSGFKSWKEWGVAILGFIPSGKAKYMYKVERCAP